MMGATTGIIAVMLLTVTGFAFERPEEVPVTPLPSAETLRVMREVVGPQLAEVYPQFAARVFGVSLPEMLPRALSE